jgi:hypothetical protein
MSSIKKTIEAVDQEDVELIDQEDIELTGVWYAPPEESEGEGKRGGASDEDR